MKLLKPFAQILALHQYNRENPQNQISTEGVCSRLAFKWAAMQLVQSPFKYEDVNIKKTYGKQKLKTKDVVEKLKARKVDTEGMDTESDRLAWRGGLVSRKGKHVFEAAYRDQLFSNEFTASDKKKYAATVKWEADKSIDNPFPANPNVSGATVEDALDMSFDTSFVNSLSIGQDKALLIKFYWKDSEGKCPGHQIAISNQRPPLLYDPNHGVYEFESSDIDGIKKEICSFIRDKYPFKLDSFNIQSLSNPRELSLQSTAIDTDHALPMAGIGFLREYIAELPSDLDWGISPYQEAVEEIHNQLRQKDLLFLTPELSAEEIRDFLLETGRKLLDASKEKLKEHAETSIDMPTIPTLPRYSNTFLSRLLEDDLGSLNDLNKILVSTLGMIKPDEHIEAMLGELRTNQESISKFPSPPKPSEQENVSVLDDDGASSVYTLEPDIFSETDLSASSQSEITEPFTPIENLKKPLGQDAVENKIEQWLDKIPSVFEVPKQEIELPLSYPDEQVQNKLAFEDALAEHKLGLKDALARRPPLREAAPPSREDQEYLALYGELLGLPDRQRLEKLRAFPDALDFDESILRGMRGREMPRPESSPNASDDELEKQMRELLKKARPQKNREHALLYLQAAFFVDHNDRVEFLKSKGVTRFNEEAAEELRKMVGDILSIEPDPNALDKNENKLHKQIAYLGSIGITLHHLPTAHIAERLKRSVLLGDHAKLALQAIPPRDNRAAIQSLYKETLLEMNDKEIRAAHILQRKDIWEMNERALEQLPKTRLSPTKKALIVESFRTAGEKKWQQAYELYADILKLPPEKATALLKKEGITQPHWAALENYSPEDRRTLYAAFRRNAASDDLRDELYYRSLMTLGGESRKRVFLQDLSVWCPNKNALRELSEDDRQAIQTLFQSAQAEKDAATEHLYRYLAESPPDRRLAVLANDEAPRLNERVLHTLPLGVQRVVLETFRDAVVSRFAPLTAGEEIVLETPESMQQELNRLESKVPRQIGEHLRIGKSRLGQGGFGDVYPAVDEYGNQVVLKVITKEDPKDRKRATAMADHELEMHMMVSKSPHPNIARCYGQRKVVINGEEKNVTVIERITGIDGFKFLENLTEAFRGGLISQGQFMEATMFLMDAARKATAHMASLGVVHADIKPENLMIDLKNQRIAIIDMGLALNKQGRDVDKPYWYAAPSHAFQKTPSESWLNEPAKSDSPLRKQYGADAIGTLKILSSLDHFLQGEPNARWENPARYSPQTFRVDRLRTSLSKLIERVRRTTDPANLYGKSLELENPYENNEVAKLPMDLGYKPDRADFESLRDRADPEAGMAVIMNVVRMANDGRLYPDKEIVRDRKEKQPVSEAKQAQLADLLQKVNSIAQVGGIPTQFENAKANLWLKELEKIPFSAGASWSAATLRLAEIEQLSNTDHLKHLERINAVSEKASAQEVADAVVLTKQAVRNTFGANSPLSLLQQLNEMPASPEIGNARIRLLVHFPQTIAAELKAQQWESNPYVASRVQYVEKSQTGALANILKPAKQAHDELNHLLSLTQRLGWSQRNVPSETASQSLNELGRLLQSISTGFPAPNDLTEISRCVRQADKLIGSLKAAPDMRLAEELHFIEMQQQRLSPKRMPHVALSGNREHAATLRDLQERKDTIQQILSVPPALRPGRMDAGDFRDRRVHFEKRIASLEGLQREANHRVLTSRVDQLQMKANTELRHVLDAPRDNKRVTRQLNDAALKWAKFLQKANEIEANFKRTWSESSTTLVDIDASITRAEKQLSTVDADEKTIVAASTKMNPIKALKAFQKKVIQQFSSSNPARPGSLDKISSKQFLKHYDEVMKEAGIKYRNATAFQDLQQQYSTHVDSCKDQGRTPTDMKSFLRTHVNTLRTASEEKEAAINTGRSGRPKPNPKQRN